MVGDGHNSSRVHLVHGGSHILAGEDIFAEGEYPLSLTKITNGAPENRLLVNLFLTLSIFI
jgi:hypothetical protein